MSELVASVSLNFRAGKTLLLEFTVTRDGAPIDTTGMTARFVIRRDEDAEAVITTEGAPPTAVAETGLGALGDQFQVAITAEDTQALHGSYKFEAELEDVSGDVEPVTRGYVTFERSIVGA